MFVSEKSKNLYFINIEFYEPQHLDVSNYKTFNKQINIFSKICIIYIAIYIYDEI